MGNSHSGAKKEKVKEKEERYRPHARGGSSQSPACAWQQIDSRDPSGSSAEDTAVETPVVPNIGSGDFGQDNVALLKHSWQYLKDADVLDQLGAAHFRRFFERSEDGARKLYVGTNMGRQVHVVTPIVEWLINNPDAEAIQALGVYHAHLGVTTTQLQTFGECFVESVMELLPAMYQRPAVKHAWEVSMARLRHDIARALQEVSGHLRGIGSDESKNALEKAAAQRAMRLKTTSAQLQRLQEPDAKGWLRVSMYAATHMKPPKRSDDHREEAFRTRWCELKGQYLIYRIYEQDKPAGIVDLSQCELMDTSSRHASRLPSPSPYSFALVNHGGQQRKYPWYFMCNGDEEKEMWYACLRQACNRFSFIRSDLFKGQRVRALLEDGTATGECRWIGRHPEEDGLWVGIAADEACPAGTDGKFDHKRYFECDTGHGLLVPAFRVAATTPLEITVQGESLPLNTYTPSQFDFLNVIGKGSFGRVCKVREAATGNIFAIKILQKAALVKESQITSVRREKSILLNLSHPFIVKLHAAFQSHGRLFLLFDFLTGGELFSYVQQCEGGHLPEAHARFYLAEVALALAHIHSMKIIHRDLKAENLVLDKHGHVVLTDFGFAKTVDAAELNTTRCGTLPYMAPEILQQTAMGYGLEVDWWAFGVLSFLLITGCYPFFDPNPRKTMKQIVQRVIELHTFPICPALTEESRRFTLRLLEKDPVQRMASVAQVQEDPWFAGFEWDACAARELTPPFVPDVRGANTKYFDVERHGAEGTSKALPPGCSAQMAQAFQSFQDVHNAYKRVTHTRSDDEDNVAFLKALNEKTVSGGTDDSHASLPPPTPPMPQQP